MCGTVYEEILHTKGILFFIVVKNNDKISVITLEEQLIVKFNIFFGELQT